MNDLRKAAEMALETLETTWGNGSEGTLKQWEETIQALRQALDDKPNYCIPLQSDRIRIDPVTGDVSIGTVSDKDFMTIEAKLREKNA